MVNKLKSKKQKGLVKPGIELVTYLRPLTPSGNSLDTKKKREKTYEFIGYLTVLQLFLLVGKGVHAPVDDLPVRTPSAVPMQFILPALVIVHWLLCRWLVSKAQF